MANTQLSDISRFIVAGVTDIFTENWEKYPLQYPEYTTKKTAQKETEIYDSVGNLKPAVDMVESESFQYGKIGQAYETRIKCAQVGNGMSFSLKSRAFDLYSIVNGAKADELAHTMRDIEEEKAIAPWNNAFATNLADGVPMCSNSKPLLHVAGAFNDTLTTGALTDPDNIKTAVKMFSSFKNHYNKPMKSYPNQIFTHDVNMMDIEEIFKASMKTHEMSNTPNVLPKLKPVYSVWLTSQAAWFLVDTRFTHVIWQVHKSTPGPVTEWEENFQNKDLQGTVYELVAAGALPNIGIVGSAG